MLYTKYINNTIVHPQKQRNFHTLFTYFTTILILNKWKLNFIEPKSNFFKPTVSAIILSFDK